jgi:hypothetical protein
MTCWTRECSTSWRNLDEEDCQLKHSRHSGNSWSWFFNHILAASILRCANGRNKLDSNFARRMRSTFMILRRSSWQRDAPGKRSSATENEVLRTLDKASEVVMTTLMIVQGVLVTVEVAPKQKGLVPRDADCRRLHICFVWSWGFRCVLHSRDSSPMWSYEKFVQNILTSSLFVWCVYHRCVWSLKRHSEKTYITFLTQFTEILNLMTKAHEAQTSHTSLKCVILGHGSS